MSAERPLTKNIDVKRGPLDLKAYEKAGFKPHLLTMRMDLRKE